MEEIVVGAKRVAMGDWMGDPDVTLGWGGGVGWGVVAYVTRIAFGGLGGQP